MRVATSTFWREVLTTAQGNFGRRTMRTMQAMPCVVNGRVVLLSRHSCPRLSARYPAFSTNLKGQPSKAAKCTRIVCQNGLDVSLRSRWQALSGEGLSPCSSLRGFESGRREQKSSHPRVRTFAKSPEGPDNSTNSEGLKPEDEAKVEKIFEKSFLFRAAEALDKELTKPEICTADELHYVAVPGTTWRLALWRYLPPPNAPKRNHPLLMLSGIGTNAIGFDLDPSVSMARTMAEAGFDSWILEVRGAGLSKFEKELAEDQKLDKESDVPVIEDAADLDNGGGVPSSERPRQPLGRDTNTVDSGLNKVSSDPPAGEETRAPTGVATNKPYETALKSMEQDSTAEEDGGLLAEDGTVTKANFHSKRSRAAMSEDGASIEINSPSKRASHSNELTGSADEETQKTQEVGAVKPKEVQGASTWETATQFSELVVKLTDKLSKLITDGQSRIFSTRFIDSVASLFEDSAVVRRIAGLRERVVKLMETQETRTILVNQLSDLRKKLAQLLEDGQGAVSPQVNTLQDRFNRTMDDFQSVVGLIEKYDWDFDNYLEEDVPTAMEYIRNRCKPVDGKLLSVGHSMGGIVLYALLSSRGNDCGLAGAVTLSSALDYQCSNTSLKLLLPLADPAQVFNVPLVPLGGLMTAVHPLVTVPPYALAWLGYNVSAKNMMETALFSRLVLNNFGTVPVKLLLHLTTVFKPGGLSNRDGTFHYKENIDKITVPVLAVAGDQDLICPPTAVMDTVNVFPKETVTYKCFGGEVDRHYGHYDVVCSPGAKEEVFPVLVDFLVQHDDVKVGDKVLQNCDQQLHETAD